MSVMNKQEWFVYDSAFGLDRFPTEEQALTEATERLAEFRELAAEEGWDDGADSIVVAQVTHAAVSTNIHHRGTEDEYHDMEIQRIYPNDTQRLQWLADNMQMNFGKRDRAQWLMENMPLVVDSDRETCRLDDLRKSIDEAMQDKRNSP